MYLGHGTKLIYHRSPRCQPLHPASSHKGKTTRTIWWFEAFCVKRNPGTVNTQVNTYSSNTKNRNCETRVRCHVVDRFFCKTDVSAGPSGTAARQQGRTSHSSYRQATLLSHLVSVTARLAELCPTASVQRTRSPVSFWDCGRRFRADHKQIIKLRVTGFLVAQW